MGQLHRTELPELSRKLDNAFCMMPSYKNGAIYRDVRRALGHHLGGGVPRMSPIRLALHFQPNRLSTCVKPRR